MAAADDAAWAADVADLARAERMSVHLVDRLRAQTAPVRAHLADGAAVTAAVSDCGQDWVLLGDDLLVPLTGVTHVEQLGSAATPAADGPLARRLSLNVVLRGLVRRRAAVEVRCQGGAYLTGTLDAVAADHVDLAAHDLDVPRRQANVRAVHAVRTAAIVSVRVR